MSDIDAIFKLFNHYRSDVVDLSRSYNKLFDEVLKIKRDIRELKGAKPPVKATMIPLKGGRYGKNIKRLESVQKYLFAYAFHLCGNVNDSKDLVQDTNIRILDNLDKFRYGDNFRGWCAVIMRNLYHNQCLRYKPVPVDDPALYACDMLEDGNTLQNIRDEYQRVNRVMRDKGMIELSLFIEGYNYLEISDRTKNHIGTVKSRIFFQRKNVLKLLNRIKF